MIDSRLTQMRETLEAAQRFPELQCRWLLRDVINVLDEFTDENLTIHDAIDIEQARLFVTSAARQLADGTRLIGLAIAEIKALEDAQ